MNVSSVNEKCVHNDNRDVTVYVKWGTWISQGVSFRNSIVQSIVSTACTSSTCEEANSVSCLHCFRELVSIRSSDSF